jgi:hypothetical protein
MKEITLSWNEFVKLMDYVDPGETIEVTLTSTNEYSVIAQPEIIDSFAEDNLRNED